MSSPPAQHGQLAAADLDRLRTAARLAWRGHGLVEPNPMVGCVIAGRSGKVVGFGHHRRFGGPHAEIMALRMAGGRAKGGTCYVTLEPCNHTGKTGPCTEALIEQGISRVVIGRADPNPTARGGAARLHERGIEVIITDRCPEAISVTDPYVRRIRTGLPWMIVKWAQTLDGRITTRPPDRESQWISSPASRLVVHRKRAKVDAILTGIGTVIADDPMLKARNVRIRRTARRVIVDPKLDISLSSAIIRSAGVVPTTIACLATADGGSSDHALTLQRAGIELLRLDGDQHGNLPLTPLLRHLVTKHDATNVLVEAGPGLMSRLFGERVVCELWTFTAPLLLGDDEAAAPVHGRHAPRLADGIELTLLDHRRRGDDVFARYQVGMRKHEG